MSSRSALGGGSVRFFAAVVTTFIVGLSLCSGARVAALSGEQVTSQPAPQRTSKLTMIVQGDSISAIGRRGRYYDDAPGSRKRVWLGRVEDRFDIEVDNVAIGGAGLLRAGNSNPRADDHKRFACKGESFLMQLDHPAVRRRIRDDDFMGIFGGFNDSSVCDGSGDLVKAQLDELTQAVNVYMDRVAKIRTDAGHSAATTIVGTPWPTGVNRWGRASIPPIIRTAALAHGFTWVDFAGVLTDRNTIDGVHPDYVNGTRDMAMAFVEGAEFAQRVADVRLIPPGVPV